MAGVTGKLLREGPGNRRAAPLTTAWRSGNSVGLGTQWPRRAACTRSAARYWRRLSDREQVVNISQLAYNTVSRGDGGKWWIPTSSVNRKYVLIWADLVLLVESACWASFRTSETAARISRERGTSPVLREEDLCRYCNPTRNNIVITTDLGKSRPHSG